METGSDDSVLALLFHNLAWDKQIIISPGVVSQLLGSQVLLDDPTICFINT